MVTIHKPAARPATKPVPHDPTKELAMVFLQSIGVGMMAVILLLAGVLLLVGIYVQVIWPLTDWDLVNVHIESYNSAITAVLIGVFIGGFAAGYWCISGNAWKRLPGPTGVMPRTVARARR